MGLFGSQPLVDLNRGPQMDPLDVNVPRRPNAGDWFFSPDQSTTRGKLGLLGEYLMGASGGPLASLGNGLLGMRQQGQAEQDMELERELKRAQIEARGAPRIVETGRGGVIAIDPRTGEPVWEREGAPVRGSLASEGIDLGIAPQTSATAILLMNEGDREGFKMLMCVRACVEFAKPLSPIVEALASTYYNRKLRDVINQESEPMDMRASGMTHYSNFDILRG